jgi:hypothetical protein
MNTILEKAEIITDLNEKFNYLNSFYTESINEYHKKEPFYIQLAKELKTEMNKTEDLILLQGIETQAKEKNNIDGLNYLIDIKSIYLINPPDNILNNEGLTGLKYYSVKEFTDFIDKIIEPLKKQTEIKETKQRKIKFNIKPYQFIELIKVLQISKIVEGKQKDIVNEFSEFFNIEMNEETFRKGANKLLQNKNEMFLTKLQKEYRKYKVTIKKMNEI